MELKSLMVDMKSAWIEYPGMEGFKIEVVNLARDRLISLRKSCINTKFNKARMPVEELDEKKFVREFTKATVKNWEGLKLTYLEELMLVDISGRNPEELLEYSEENALLLASNSGEFDSWLNDSVFDLANFRGDRNGGAVEASGDVAE